MNINSPGAVVKAPGAGRWNKSPDFLSFLIFEREFDTIRIIRMVLEACNVDTK